MIWNGSGGMGRRLWTLRNCSLERDAREEGGRGRAHTVLPWFLVSAVGRTKGPGCKNRRFAANYGAGLMPAPPWAAGFGRGALQIRLLFLHTAP